MEAVLIDIGHSARRRIAIRLLPFVFVMYVTCYVDRANVSFANLRMSTDLGFSDRVYGLGVGIFFVGYMLFEVPGAIIVERWSARKWLARIMITWGLVTVVTGFVHSARQFYLARFVLGVAEASFFPGIMLSGLAGPRVVLLVALPGLFGIAAMLLNGWHSDKTGERRWQQLGSFSLEFAR